MSKTTLGAISATWKHWRVASKPAKGSSAIIVRSGSWRAIDASFQSDSSGRVVHRVHQRDEPDLAHPLEVLQDPLAVHRHALEAGVEAERDEPELVGGAVDLGERVRAVVVVPRSRRRPGTVRACRSRYAAISSLTPARVGDAVRPEVAVAGDHERLVHAALVHDAQPLCELDAGELLRHPRSAPRGRRRARRRRGPTWWWTSKTSNPGAGCCVTACQLGPELERGAAQHQRRGRGSERLRHACWASATRSAYERSWVCG